MVSAVVIYSLCFMLVYSIYCIVVSLLLFSLSIDKPCICKYFLSSPASIVRKPFVGGKVMYVIIYLISIKLVVVVKNMIINLDLIIFKTISTDWHVLV